MEKAKISEAEKILAEARANFDKGVALAEKDDFTGLEAYGDDHARDYFSKAIELDPNFAEAYY